MAKYRIPIPTSNTDTDTPLPLSFLVNKTLISEPVQRRSPPVKSIPGIETWSRTKNLLTHHPSSNFTGGSECEIWPRFLANVNSSSCSLYVVVRPSVVCLSLTLVHPTQAIEIFGNISMPCGTLAIHYLSVKILRRSSQGKPSVGGDKHKRGSQM